MPLQSTLLASFLAVATATNYENIVGYAPGSKVTDHNAIDRDQAAMESALAGSSPDYARAKNIYENGGNSKPLATLTLATALTGAVAKDTVVTGKTATNTDVSGVLNVAAAAQATTIEVKYDIDDQQAFWVGCRVGGLANTTTWGCFSATYDVVITGYTGDSTNGASAITAVANTNGRTIQGFSLQAQSKMYTCTNCPYKDYNMYYTWYGDYTYADKWVLGAMDGTATGFTTQGNADFSTVNDAATRRECANKGTSYKNVWKYVIREFEDAIDDCQNNCISCNDDPVHAWDEGVAFYAGSYEGASGNSGGVMPYRLAEKRCSNFRTCGSDGTALSGTSKVNFDLFAQFALGQSALQQGRCAEVRPITDRIVDLMTVPLIQGTLRYAYKTDYLLSSSTSTQLKEKAEGAVFAAAVLPRVAHCSTADATTIYNNMRIGVANDAVSFESVKAAFERNYACLNITCADVGGLWDSTNNAYYSQAIPCVTPVSTGSNDDIPTWGIVVIVIVAILMVLFLGMVIFMMQREKAGKPIFLAVGGASGSTSTASAAKNSAV